MVLKFVKRAGASCSIGWQRSGQAGRNVYRKARLMAGKKTNVNRVFHALGDPTRRAIVERLSEGPISVSRLAAGWYEPKRPEGYALATSNPRAFRWRSTGSATAARCGNAGLTG